MIKVTAVTKRGAPIISIHVRPDETLDAIMDKISDQLNQNSSRRGFLDKWILDGRNIRVTGKEK